MEDVTKNMNDLFALAKNAKVEYPIDNITNVISSAAATTGAVGGASAFFNLSNIAIMLGSILSVATIAIVMNTGEKSVNTVVENQPQQTKERIIEKQHAICELPLRSFIEQNELVSPIDIEPEAPLIEEEIIVEQVISNEEPEMAMVESPEKNGGGEHQAFHSVHLNISADVTIRKGESSHIGFDGDAEMADLLETTVNNGVLYINIKDGRERDYRKRSYNKSVKVVLTMNEIKNLVINGSGDIYAADDIRSEDLSIQINGSGDVRLDKIVPTKFDISVNGSGDVSLYGKGDMQRGEININGSGDVCTKSIDISVIAINITGSGDVNVSCQEKLDINILGSGDVCYSGSPEVNMNQMGTGDVHNCQ